MPLPSLIRNHSRLWIGLLVGCMIYFFLPAGWAPISRVLVSWDCGVALFLALVYWWMSRLTAEQICTRYIEEDSSAPFLLVGTILAALLSLVAIVEPLATLRHVGGLQRVAHFGLATITLMNSWLLVPTMFTTYYADMFYSVQANERPLRFPETAMPVFWDFAYFSFTISAACQTADVSTTRASMRKIIVFHELISFAFNAAILGFAINVTAGLIGGA
jgi:uncharacterized membrane protein